MKMSYRDIGPKQNKYYKKHVQWATEETGVHRCVQLLHFGEQLQNMYATCRGLTILITI